MPKPAPYRIRSVVTGLLAGCAALYAAWKSAEPTLVHPTTSEVSAYYSGSVVPLLDASAKRDRDAANLAIRRLHAHFAEFHSGIPTFAEDITGWGSRFGVAGRSVKDLWTKFWDDPDRATATREYVNTKFRAHIVSEEKLQRAIEDSLAVFREAIAANHNRTVAEVELAFSMPESPLKVPTPELSRLLAGPAFSSLDLNAQQGAQNLVQTGALVGSGILADAAAKRLVAAIFTRLAVNTAATVATEASAAAGATATGGAVGTTAGPAGTVIGVGVGIAVSLIIDWWMTDSFKAKLHEQCGAYLHNLEREIASGSANSTGLRKTLEDSALANQKAFRNLIERSLSIPLP
jgi:hypothetical protein